MATSDDVLGLVLEHGSLDVLMARVKLAVPELLELNETFHRLAILHYFTIHNAQRG